MLQLKSKEELQKEQKVEEEKKVKAKFDTMRETPDTSASKKSSQDPPPGGTQTQPRWNGFH